MSLTKGRFCLALHYKGSEIKLQIFCYLLGFLAPLSLLPGDGIGWSEGLQELHSFKTAEGTDVQGFQASLH